MLFPRRFAGALLACGCVFAPQAGAQYDVDAEDRAWLRALVDLRLARGPEVPSWTDSGPGKTRYGGRATDAGFEHVTRAALGLFALEAGAVLPGGVRAQLQLNVQPDIAGDYNPWIVEAHLRKEWGEAARGFGLQAGAMTIPFALEHSGPAWTPERTISASALNSWLWEEFSIAGLEGEWWHEAESGLRLGLLAGAGVGPDLFGRLLALRGFAMGDAVGSVSGDLPLPNGTRTDLFDEQDDRVAAYALVTLGDSGERATLKLGAFDNRGDQGVAGVWRTRLATAGLTVHPHPQLDVLFQYLEGEARVRDPSNDSDLRAWYGLVSFRHRDQRFSLRYDDFRVDDADAGNPTSEDGEAVTLAWFLNWGLRHRIGGEYIWLDSHRPGGAADPLSSDQFQLSYRFRY
jgi:hypothetical protein